MASYFFIYILFCGIYVKEEIHTIYNIKWVNHIVSNKKTTKNCVFGKIFITLQT